jgi:hypothetical protein
MPVWNTTPFGAGAPNGSVKISQLLYTAFRIAGILSRAGRGIGTSETADGVHALNSMLDSWNTEKLTVPAVRRITLPLSSGQKTIALGPVRLEAVAYEIGNGREYPMRLATPEQWQITNKAITANPEWLFLEGTSDGTADLAPIPGQAMTLVLYLWDQLSAVNDADGWISLGPAYQRAIEYNLALELVDRFPEQAKPSPRIVEVARAAKLAIKSSNHRPIVGRVDPALLSWGGPGRIRR